MCVEEERDEERGGRGEGETRRGGGDRRPPQPDLFALLPVSESPPLPLSTSPALPLPALFPPSGFRCKVMALTPNGTDHEMPFLSCR
jgi:hypothetical protein